MPARCGAAKVMMTSIPGATETAAAELRRLAQFDGEPGEFWRRFVEVMVRWCGARHGLVVVGTGDRWHAAARLPSGWGWEAEVGVERLRQWGARVAAGEEVPWSESIVTAPDREWCVAPLRTPGGAGVALAVVEVSAVEASEVLDKLSALLAAPELYEQRRQAGGGAAGSRAAGGGAGCDGLAQRSDAIRRSGHGVVQ
jgi:hypothetical protein